MTTNHSAVGLDDLGSRPSEVQLGSELGRMRRELIRGFDARRDVIRWAQQLCVRTLGEIPNYRYYQLAECFTPDQHGEGVLLAAFLNEDARTRQLDDERARQLRERWAADTIAATQASAFRQLRKSAGEYIGEDDTGTDTYAKNPDAFLMRPALQELDDFQARALNMVLLDPSDPESEPGLPDQSTILEWGDVLMNATRGEPIDPRRGPGAFVPRCYRQPETVQLLTDPRPAYQRARETFLATWLLPVFNRAVQDLSNRTAEQPELEETAGDPTGAPDWN